MYVLITIILIYLLYYKINTTLFLSLIVILEVIIRFSVRKLFLLILLVILMFASNNTYKNSDYSFALEPSRVKTIIGKVVSDSSSAKYTKTLTVKLENAYCSENNSYSAKGIIRVNCKNIEAFTGDEILFNGKLSEYGFNAKSYKILKRGTIAKRRKLCIDFIDSKIKGTTDEERQLTKLLLLGIKEKDDYPLKELSRKSGSAFVLALSGMHLSFFALGINRLLFFLGKRNSKIISLIILTFYVIIVGAKASLIRALLLTYSFSFRKGNRNKILLETLILHLIFFPDSVNTLASIYSYLALTAILGISGYIKKGLNSIYYLPNGISSSISASTAALIFTSQISYSTFSSYQMSIILTGGIISFLTFSYMSIAVFSLFFPFLLELNHYCYIALEFMMKSGAKVKECTSMFPIICLIALIIALLLIKRREIIH